MAGRTDSPLYGLVSIAARRARYRSIRRKVTISTASKEARGGGVTEETSRDMGITDLVIRVLTRLLLVSRLTGPSVVRNFALHGIMVQW